MKRFAVIFIILCLLPSLSSAQECDYSVEILLNGTEFTKESFRWRMKAIKLDGVSTNMTGTARIEDLSGNLVKSYKPWTNLPISKQKTSNEYSPNLKEGGYSIISEIIVDCDDINKGDNTDFKAITIKPENIGMQEPDIASNLSIAENQEQQNTTQQTQKDEVIYNSSINQSQHNQIQPEENNTKEYENTANLRNENKQDTTQISETVKSNEETYAYVSSNEKAKNLILYFLLTISIILNILLIWKR